MKTKIIMYIFGIFLFFVTISSHMTLVPIDVNQPMYTPTPKTINFPPTDTPKFDIYSNFPPPITQTDFMQIPIMTSYYDPRLGGINCQFPCNQTAVGIIITEQMYGKVAACPEGFTTRGSGTFVINIDNLGEFWCIDRGGAINITYKTNVYDSSQNKYTNMWVIIIDILWDHNTKSQWWWMNTHFSWSISQKSYNEFIKP